MAEAKVERQRTRRGHAVLLTLPDEVMVDLSEEARRRTVPVATAARQLMKERLDQLNGNGR